MVSAEQSRVSYEDSDQNNRALSAASNDTTGQIVGRATHDEGSTEDPHHVPTDGNGTPDNGQSENSGSTAGTSDDAPQSHDSAGPSIEQQSGAENPTAAERTMELTPRSAAPDLAAAANEQIGSQGQGNVVLTSTGELYRVLPHTYNSRSSDTMKPLPFIPLLDKNDDEYRDSVSRYKAIENYNRNFNGLGTAPDGTRYVIENGLGKHACGVQTTRYRVWKFPLGATEWTLHKTWSMGTTADSEVDISSVGIRQGRAKLKGLCIQGGGIDPVTGNYFVGGVVTRSNGNNGDKAFYLFEIDKDSGDVTPRGWVRVNDSDQSDGDIIFDTAGNMIIGIGSTRGGTPSLKQYTVSQSQLRSANDVNTLIMDGAFPKHISLPGLSKSTAPTGMSVSPEGTLFVSTHNIHLSNAVVYEVTSDGLRRVQTMPDIIEMAGHCLPNPKDPIWLGYGIRRLPPYNPESGSGGWSCSNGVLPLTLWTKEITDIDGYRDPAWITLEKNVEKRASGDQFELKVEAPNFGTWSATTRGQTEGIQAEKVGRQAIPVGTELKISETITSNRSLEDDYKVSLQCVGKDGNAVTTSAVTVSGKTASATVTVPAEPARNNPASDITCTFTNKYTEKGTIELTKLDSTGNAFSTLPGAVFELYVDGNEDGKYQADQDTLVPDSRRTSNNAGLVTWAGLKYGHYLVKEVTPPAGYGPTAAEADGYHAVVLDAPVKRERMLNDPLRGSLIWGKFATGNAPSADQFPAVNTDPNQAVYDQRNVIDKLLPGSSWKVMYQNKQAGQNQTMPDGQAEWVVEDCSTGVGGRCDGLYDKDPRPGLFRIDGLSMLSNNRVVLVEERAPDGYAKSTVEHAFTVDLAHRYNYGIITNDPAKGTVTWKKVDDATPANPLGGSEWTLTAPNGATHTVTDCVKAACAAPRAGTFADTDPAKGTLSLAGQLPWGTYTLKESKAPTGYTLSDRTLTFTIDKNNLNVNVTDPVVNYKATSPTLPLTGGMSADVFRLSALGTLSLAALLILHLRRRKVVS